MVMAMRFKRLSNCIVFSFKVCCLVVALRIELSAIRLSDGYGLQPSTTISSVGCVGIEPLSIAPNDLCQPLHFTPDSCYVSGQAGIEPCHLDCKSKPRSYGKPISYCQ